MAHTNLAPKLPFLIFPSLNPVMFWRVVAVETNRTISNHKHLVSAVEKAQKLNQRGHCQEPDCYELADVSETQTSLAHCYRHHWERRNAFAFYLRRMDRGDV